jgi:hypothetical protein
MRHLATCTLLVLLCCLAGCNSPQSRVVGKWQVEGTDLTWEFRSNGNALSGERPARWSLGDNNRLKIETGPATFMYEVAFPDRDRMAWRDMSGGVTNLRRIE